MKTLYISFEYKDKNTLQRTEEMAHWLREHAVLPKDQNFKFPALTSGSPC